MKLPYYIITLLLFVCSLSQPLKAQTIEEEQLVGTWTMDFETTKQNMSKKAKNKYNNISLTIKERIENNHIGRQFIFLSNGTFTQILSNKRTTSGTWHISDNTLELTNTKNQTRALLLKKLTSKHLVLVNHKYTNGLIATLCFEKTK